MSKLIKQQIERQDFVDNEIFALLQKILSPLEKITWNIEMVGAVREVMRTQIVEKKKVMNEMQFYPYLKTQTQNFLKVSKTTDRLGINIDNLIK